MYSYDMLEKSTYSFWLLNTGREVMAEASQIVPIFMVLGASLANVE